MPVRQSATIFHFISFFDNHVPPYYECDPEVLFSSRMTEALWTIALLLLQKLSERIVHRATTLCRGDFLCLHIYLKRIESHAIHRGLLKVLI